MAVVWKEIAYKDDLDTHASQHAVSGSDSIFPADPDADRLLMWDNDPGELVWTSAGAGDVTAAANITDHAIVRGDGGAKGVQHASTATIDDDGVMTLTGQSGCGVRLVGNQQIPNEEWTKLAFSTEQWDIQNEFNNQYVIGIADATEANKLHDADGGFDAGMVGASVWNTTDNTYTTVSAFVDSGELTLTDNIMVNGEGYVIYWAKFTASVAGKYVVTGQGYLNSLDDQNLIALSIKKNGTFFGNYNTMRVGKGGGAGIAMAATLDLSVSDYVEIFIYHNNGAAREATATDYSNVLQITKVA